MKHPNRIRQEELESLPSQGELARIAAAVDPSISEMNQRMQAAYDHWTGAAVFLHRQRLKIQWQIERTSAEIEQCNADSSRLAAEAEELAKDPYGLHPLAVAGIVRVSDFIKAVLPDEISRPSQLRDNPEDPDGPMIEKALPPFRWRKESRDKAFRDWVLGAHAVFPDGDTTKEPEWKPNFEPDAQEDLRAFLANGIPIKEALMMADLFRSASMGQREFATLDRAAKGGAALKQKRAAEKASGPQGKRRGSKWDKIGKAPRKTAKKAAGKKRS